MKSVETSKPPLVSGAEQQEFGELGRIIREMFEREEAEIEASKAFNIGDRVRPNGKGVGRFGRAYAHLNIPGEVLDVTRYGRVLVKFGEGKTARYGPFDLENLKTEEDK